MFLEAGLLTRRSVRQFEKGRTIPHQDIEDLLKIAMYAPSGYNKQPWEFVVVEDETLKEQITQIHPHASFLKDASAAIVVCGNTEEQLDENFWLLDTSAAAENLLLAIHGKGLGRCWCAVYPYEKRMKEFQEILNLPEHIKPNAMIVLGYPAKIPVQPKDRFKPEKIHYNRW